MYKVMQDKVSARSVDCLLDKSTTNFPGNAFREGNPGSDAGNEIFVLKILHKVFHFLAVIQISQLVKTFPGARLLLEKI